MKSLSCVILKGHYNDEVTVEARVATALKQNCNEIASLSFKANGMTAVFPMNPEWAYL